MSLPKNAATHGSYILDQVEESLGLSLKRSTPAERWSKILSLPENSMEKLVADVVNAHRKSSISPHEVSINNGGDFCVADSSTQPVTPEHIRNLLLYSEGVLIPDPLLSHPLAIRQVFHSHFHATYPYAVAALRRFLMDAVDFYADYQYAIRNGLVVLTSWNLLMAMQNEVQNHFTGDGEPGDEFAKALPSELIELAKKRAHAYHSEFKNGTSTLHRGVQPVEGVTSQIGVIFEGDPEDARIHVETHFSITGAEESEAAGRIAKLIQAPPHTKEAFEKWREGGILKEMHNRVAVIKVDLLQSTGLGIPLMTRSGLTWNVATHLTRERGGNPASIPEAAVAELELPSLDELSLNKVVNIRTDSEALAVFRKGLRDACRSIKSTPGTPEFKRDLEMIRRDFVENGINKLRKQHRLLRVKSATEIALSTIAIAVATGSVLSGGLTWVTGLLGAAGAAGNLRAFRDAVLNEAELKKEPLYMLWNATRKPFHAK